MKNPATRDIPATQSAFHVDSRVRQAHNLTVVEYREIGWAEDHKMGDPNGLQPVDGAEDRSRTRRDNLALVLTPRNTQSGAHLISNVQFL